MSPQTLLKALNTVCAYDHCRVLLPWFSYAHGDRPLARLRRAALQVGRPDALEPGLALLILAAFVHPVRVLRETVFSMKRLGRASGRVYGVGILRQFFGALYCGLRHNLGPEHYFYFRMHDRPLADWSEFISHEECTGLLLRLRAESTGHAERDIWSKQSWQRFCERQAIPTVPIWATAGPGGVSFLKEKTLLRGKDLFLKPDEDYSGRGGVLLSWVQEPDGWRAEGALSAFLPEEKIETFLQDAGGKAMQVLQQRLRNSPSLEGFSPARW